MKALVCAEYGDPEGLRVTELPEPQRAAGQILIEVEHAGVSFVDTLTIRNLHQNPHPVPFAPGMEVVGQVLEAEADSRFCKGQRVAALVYDGGHAQRAVAAEHEAFPLPDGCPGDVVAASLSVYLTSYLALTERTRVLSGETVLVTGASGGVGLAAVDIAKHLGARVVALASSAEKREIAEKQGAEVTLDSSDEDLGDRLREMGRSDVVVDVVGGRLAEATFRTLDWGGRFLSLGFAGGGVPKFPANLLLVKNRSALGFALMYYRKHRHETLQNAARSLFSAVEDGSLKPLLREVGSLDDGPRLLRDIMNRRAFGKSALRIS
ncbi:MAG: NADPH:quinone oxidoreductase family protein [Acidobacteriota bacterium]